MIAQSPEQIPAPLPPPDIGQIGVQVGGGPPEWIAPFAAMMLLIIVGAIVLYPLVRAWARRIEGKHAADPALADELYAMRDRIAELEHQAMRVPELEERLEFAERLLLQRNDPAALPRNERGV